MLITNINPQKLYHDFIMAGVSIVNITNDLKGDQHIADNTWITFEEETDMELVKSILNNHDPSPTLTQPTTEQRIAGLEATILRLLEVL